LQQQPFQGACTLIMTATVTPPATMPGTVRNQSAVRRAEYERAFLFYLGLDDRLVDEIVVFENSDADLTSFSTLAQRAGSSKVVTLVNVSSDYPAEKGKGYAEFLMLDRGLAQLPQTSATRRFWKVTGRLQVTNFEQMVATAPAHYDIYTDMRNVPWVGETLGGNQWMELRLFSFTRRGYDSFLRGRYDIDFVLEKGLYAELMALRRERHIDLAPRFLCQPIFVGHSAYSNASYSGLGYRSKSAIRRLARRTAPWLWL
jgi:hypothetical protein